MKYFYVLKSFHDNGYTHNHTKNYFFCDTELTQEEINKLLEKFRRPRCCSTFNDFYKGALQNGMQIEPFEGLISIDPSDKTPKVDAIFDGLTGNY